MIDTITTSSSLNRIQEHYFGPRPQRTRTTEPASGGPDARLFLLPSDHPLSVTGRNIRGLVTALMHYLYWALVSGPPHALPFTRIGFAERGFPLGQPGLIFRRAIEDVNPGVVFSGVVHGYADEIGNAVVVHVTHRPLPFTRIGFAERGFPLGQPGLIFRRAIEDVNPGVVFSGVVHGYRK